MRPIIKFSIIGSFVFLFILIIIGIVLNLNDFYRHDIDYSFDFCEESLNSYVRLGPELIKYNYSENTLNAYVLIKTRCKIEDSSAKYKINDTNIDIYYQEEVASDNNRCSCVKYGKFMIDKPKKKNYSINIYYSEIH